MNCIGIIPTRMSSSRFPGKPLVDIHGMSIIEHVWRRSLLCKDLSKVYIATCDSEINQHMTQIGAEVIMTGSHHERSTDRLAEALKTIEDKEKKNIDIVVNIGGDEPLVHPDMISKSLEPFKYNQELSTVNLIAPILSDEEFRDENVVKVLIDQNKNVICFSRLPIPMHFKKVDLIKRYKQLSIIPFKRDFLFIYNALPSTPAELSESIDMMRILEHGYKIKAAIVHHQTMSVDTFAEYQTVKKLMLKDPLFLSQYE